MGAASLLQPITHLQQILGHRQVGTRLFLAFPALCRAGKTGFHILLMDVQSRTPLLEYLHLVSPACHLAPQIYLCGEILQRGWGCPKIHISRAAHEKLALASATMGGSCPHPDQSWNWLAALRASDLWVEASVPILLFFIMGGVAPT
jgi:hypothetical protein